MSKEIKDFRRKNRKKFDKAPDGYRLLKFGDEVKRGDLIHINDSGWNEVSILLNTTVNAAWFARKRSDLP